MRDAGFEVRAVSETHAGARDAAVLEMARETGCVVLTEDRDFGFLVWAARARNEGVVYLRYPQSLRHSMARSVVEFARKQPESLPGHFVVIEPGKVRIRRAD